MTDFARASASGAIALAAAQMIDIRLNGRHGTNTPLRAFEGLSGRRIQGAVPRAVTGYAVKSSLAPLAAVAAALAGPRAARRFAAAALAPLGVVATVNPAVGAATWPWHWTKSDWTRELTLKGVLAIAVLAAR